MKCFSKDTSRGYSLVEMLVYIALLSLLFLVVIEAMLAITRMSATFSIMRDLNQSGRSAIEQIVREVRHASNVDAGESVFNDANGKLQLDTVDSGGSPHVVELFLESGQVKMELDDVAVGYFTSKNVTVDELRFFHVSNTETEGVKVVLVMTAEKSGVQRNETYYHTAVLRGSY